ncbi:MAG: hypothetical protein AAB601_02565 [Patescibacteria group bacterium]
MKSIVILYHSDCPDGFGAAFAAWKRFRNRADYFAISHGMPPLPGLRGKEIYLVDIAYPAPVLKKLRAVNKRVLVIDHHESVRETVISQPEYVYDDEHSGAYLAWRYFHPGARVPLFLRYVEDMDYWRFDRPYALEIISALGLEGFDFKRWDRFARELERPRTKRAIVERGRIVKQNEDRLIERIIQFNAELVQFLGRKIFVVNSPIFESEIPNRLIEKHPPMAIVWRVRNGMKTFSIRTDGTVNAAEVAAKFGGGGHPRSAGFALPLEAPFPWTWLKKWKPTKGA